GPLGAKTLGYYFTTTAIAVLIGLFWVNAIDPGSGRGDLTELLAEQQADEETTATFGHRIQENLLPSIIPGADVAKIPILPIIFAALILGVALAFNGEQSQGATSFFSGLNEAIITIVNWIMYLAPIGVYALMAGAVAAMGLGYLTTLASYVMTVLIAL